METDRGKKTGMSQRLPKMEGPRSRMVALAAAAARIRREGPCKTPWPHAPFSLAIFSDGRRMATPAPVLRRAPPGTAFIFRDYDAPDRIRRARHLRQICRLRDILFLVGADPVLAHALDADGVHLPEGLLDIGPRLRADFPILTGACHAADALARAADNGLDAAFLSPVFATASHPGTRPLGPAAAGALACTARLPVLALGGITMENVGSLYGHGFSGFGAIGAFQ